MTLSQFLTWRFALDSTSRKAIHRSVDHLLVDAESKCTNLHSVTKKIHENIENVFRIQSHRNVLKNYDKNRKSQYLRFNSSKIRVIRVKILVQIYWYLETFGFEFGPDQWSGLDFMGI